jgi:hypothetical protein
MLPGPECHRAGEYGFPRELEVGMAVDGRAAHGESLMSLQTEWVVQDVADAPDLRRIVRGVPVTRYATLFPASVRDLGTCCPVSMGRFRYSLLVICPRAS